MKATTLLLVLLISSLWMWSCASLWDSRTARAERNLDDVTAVAMADGVITPQEAEAITRAVLEVKESAQVAYQDQLETILSGGGLGAVLGGVAFRLLQRTGIPGVMKPRKVEVKSVTEQKPK